MLLTYLNISKAEIPCEKIYLIGGSEYAFLFMYNDVFDFFTVTIKNMNGDVILSNKLSYQRNAFAPVVEELPDSRLVPVSLAEFERDESIYGRLGAENFDSVRIIIV